MKNNFSIKRSFAKCFVIFYVSIFALGLFSCATTRVPEVPVLSKYDDMITEIGAVKVENGKVVDRWSTFVNPEKHIIEVAGKEINLSFKEYSLLMVLLEAEGNVVSRDALLSRVWGEFYDESRTLDVHIRKLRIKLETAGDLIHTVKNIGYKLGGSENG